MPGDYKQSEYGRVILPLVLLRRLDCVLDPTKAQVLATLGEPTWPRPVPPAARVLRLADLGSAGVGE